jgi:hypothetical protein
MAEYRGPHCLEDDIQASLNILAGLLPVEIKEHEHHSVLHLAGLDSRKPVIQGIAVYLVGAIANCIEFNLTLRKALFAEESLSRDLYNDVVNVIGKNNAIGDERKRYERNPWIWEGISHLILHISIINKDMHPPGILLAKSFINLQVKDHGLDIIALYGEEDILGITAGECKAYMKRSADAINDAANRLREVDNNLRDAEIRATLTQFRPSLLPEQQEKLVGSFWHNERAYFPMVCCDSDHSTNWGKKRKALKCLNAPCNLKYLVPAAINKADIFFDAVAEEMRKYCSKKP